MKYTGILVIGFAIMLWLFYANGGSLTGETAVKHRGYIQKTYNETLTNPETGQSGDALMVDFNNSEVAFMASYKTDKIVKKIQASRLNHTELCVWHVKFVITRTC